MYGFGGPDGALGRGGRPIVGAVPGAATVVLVEVVEDDNDAEVFVITVVKGIGVAGLEPMMTRSPDVRFLVADIDSVPGAPCVIWNSASISLSGNARRR